MAGGTTVIRKQPCQKVTFDVAHDPKGPQAKNKRVKQTISLYLEQTLRTTRGVF